MAKKTQDRRVQRTRQLLQDALISIIIEKGYEATTVQDIIDRANVGRATFYAHFADKETLFHSRLEDLRSFIGEQQRRAPARLGFSLVMLEHAGSNLPLWRAIAGRESGAFALQRIQRMIADLAGVDLKAFAFKGTAHQRELAAQYIAGAFMAVVTWWVDQGAKLPPREVDAVFRRLVLRGLEGQAGRVKEEDSLRDQPYELQPIGWVESPLVDRAVAPRQGHEGSPDAWLAFDARFSEGLRDLQVGDDVIVLTWLDRARRDVLVVHPRGDPATPLQGVFNTRSPDRPNPIGVHRVRVLAIQGTRMCVGDLEALDGTPIVDVKPVLERRVER